MVRKIQTVFIVAVMILGTVSVVALSNESDAAITVKDGEGTSFTFSSPADKVMTIGVGMTATVIGIGCLDKIVVCDSYSKTNADPLFDNLRNYVDEGKIAAGGNIYSSGKQQLMIDMISSSDPDTGSFDKDKDVVLAVVSPSYKANLSFLEEKGFKNVMYWDSSVGSYEDIIEFVETVSMVCKGKVDSNAGQMRAVSEMISSTLAKEKPKAAEAFYITYSGGGYKVGNTSSLTTVMIEAAGGNVITKDPSKSQSTIEVSLPILKQDHPDAVIFADSQIASSPEHLKYLRDIFSDDAKIVALENIWNNFSIESAKGVWTMASALYPDLFNGDVPEAGGSDDNTLLYVAASIVAVVIILAVAFLFMRSSKHTSKRKNE